MADFLTNLLGFGIVALAYNLAMAQVVRSTKSSGASRGISNTQLRRDNEEWCL